MAEKATVHLFYSFQGRRARNCPPDTVVSWRRVIRLSTANVGIVKRTLKKLLEGPIKRTLARHNYAINRISDSDYPSETSKCRPRLAQYCVGYGVDLGFGGDPINASAIRVDQPRPYSHVGLNPVQLGGSAGNLFWFRDNVLDYVYSSHLLEDFEETKPVLIEWLRVLKPGGRLIVFCPDEQIYREHCRRTGTPYNTAHKIADFSLARVKRDLAEIGGTKVVYENPLVDGYSWEMVAEKL
jgi:predicted SAM-dependent methyltransferase